MCWRTCREDYPSRPKYIAQFKEMAEELASLQGADGLGGLACWMRLPIRLPENSGSAFFTYGFAYGINSGILERAKYQPVVEKAWKGLLSHIYEDGRLGCIQPVGAAPGRVHCRLELCFRYRSFSCSRVQRFIGWCTERDQVIYGCSPRLRSQRTKASGRR